MLSWCWRKYKKPFGSPEFKKLKILLSFWPNRCLEIGFNNRVTNGWIGLHFPRTSPYGLFALPLLALITSFDNLIKFLSCFFCLIAFAIKFAVSSVLIENGISSNLPWIFCQSSWTDLPKLDAYSSKGWCKIPIKLS